MLFTCSPLRRTSCSLILLRLRESIVRVCPPHCLVWCSPQSLCNTSRPHVRIDITPWFSSKILNYDKKNDECLSYCNFGLHTRQSTEKVSKVIYGIQNFRILSRMIIIFFCRKVISGFRTCSILACPMGCLSWKVIFSVVKGQCTSQRMARVYEWVLVWHRLPPECA